MAFPSTGSLPQVCAVTGPGPGLKLGARNAIQVSHVVGKIAILGAVTTASQGLHWQEAGVGNRSQELNPAAPVWDKGS